MCFINLQCNELLGPLCMPAFGACALSTNHYYYTTQTIRLPCPVQTFLCPQRMDSNDVGDTVSSVASMRVTFVVLSERFQQLLDRLPRHLDQTNTNLFFKF